MAQETQGNRSPVEQLFQLLTRILWGLYLIFWLSWLICAALIGGVALMNSRSGTAVETGTVTQFSDWQFLFIAIAMVSIYLSFRLNGFLLRPDRIWEGAKDLTDLALQLERKKKKKEKTELDEISAMRETKDNHHTALSNAIQHVLSKVVISNLILWLLVEIPLILGLVNYFYNDDWQLFLWLGLLTAVGLFLRRPSRSQLEELLARISSAKQVVE